MNHTEGKNPASFALSAYPYEKSFYFVLVDTEYSKSPSFPGGVKK